MAVMLRCARCGQSAAVSTRLAFGVFQERHAVECKGSWVSIDGSLDDVLALPPYPDLPEPASVEAARGRPAGPRYVAGMPQEPEFAERYADAKRAYEQAADSPPGDAGALEAKARYREALSAYLLDLQVNGMTVPPELEQELSALD